MKTIITRACAATLLLFVLVTPATAQTPLALPVTDLIAVDTCILLRVPKTPSQRLAKESLPAGLKAEVDMFASEFWQKMSEAGFQLTASDCSKLVDSADRIIIRVIIGITPRASELAVLPQTFLKVPGEDRLVPVKSTTGSVGGPGVSDHPKSVATSLAAEMVKTIRGAQAR